MNRRAALQPDDVVIGGGNAKKLGRAPKGVRVGVNANAFLGGFRLWPEANVGHAKRPGVLERRRPT